jgi:hypothetical protein
MSMHTRCPSLLFASLLPAFLWSLPRVFPRAVAVAQERAQRELRVLQVGQDYADAMFGLVFSHGGRGAWAVYGKTWKYWGGEGPAD